MIKLNRRAFLRYLAAAGAAGAVTWLGYQRWHTETVSSSLQPARLAATTSDKNQAPVLLLTNNATNPFGVYLGEILRAEGLNLFQTADVQTLAEGQLSRFALVLLAEGTLSEKQVIWLEEYVAAGGRLIAMRPDNMLTPLGGVELETGVTAEGYLKIDETRFGSRSFAAETLQFHGQANHYRPVDATVIAQLYADRLTPTDLPAVTLRQHGTGWVALWAFDLARSIAYTRQGNPLWVQQERDGADGIRAHDAFVDWIDLERLPIPQADEQMRLLSGLIHEMLAEVLPLPHLWYFPNASPAMLIVTGDAHANPTGNIEALLPLVEAHQGAMSVYFTPPARSENSLRRSAGLAVQQIENWFNPFPTNPEHLPTPAEVEAWRARGHEFSLHPYVERRGS
ncbi:MAG: twin-arginine translocation signal domain-containing protein [Anaerolineales bacterium]|nr:twin-arginine translocation signal domain-containing protein [Anaerolineales bacterium]